ncbi:MAG TPA: carbamoyl phosphate synthase small subunit [Elusimicrobia bacterium]|nr:MAG: carbamoyl phosphate synthase small subunit [Elusimicrobia bacterium GWA2_66_18]HAZ08834.1 carbamoyl phosphate synthase small subunit [Elusimicrobiota bacterium]
MNDKAWLALEDGTVFAGRACGAAGEAAGESVFNTAMTGYQEILTDPSYCGQLVAMTYPQIGNYGITARDHESGRPRLSGFIVRELCKTPSNYECVESVGDFLKKHGIVAIEDIDTRALTLKLRDQGALRGVISTLEGDHRRLAAKARAASSMAGRNLAKVVTCEKIYAWENDISSQPDLHVAVMDFGVKRGILRCLAAMGAKVTVVPASTKAADILRLKPDGVLLSNGPGDPEPVAEAIETIKNLLPERLPLFGICLGHQLLGLALGGKTYKLKFGHHGANHPVKDLETGKIEITSQNHGFCVDLNSLPKEVKTTHVNLNDGTSEGMAHSQLPVFSVQYHPEASPGPHDSRYLFERFRAKMLEGKEAMSR